MSDEDISEQMQSDVGIEITDQDVVQVVSEDEYCLYEKSGKNKLKR